MKMMHRISRFPRPLIIFTVALLIRLVLFLIMSPWQKEVETNKLIQADAIEYHNIAVNLVEENGYSKQTTPPFQPNLRRTPVYPLFIAAHYFLFGFKPYLILLCQLIIGALTCVMTFKLGELIFHDKVAMLAGLLMAFDYPSVFYSNLLLTETLFTFLFVLHMYYLVKFLLNIEFRELVLSVLFLGLSTLCRPITMFIPLFLILILYLRFKGAIRKILYNNAIVFLVFLIVLSPWIIRNYHVSGKLILTSYQKKAITWKTGLNHKIKPDVVEIDAEHPTIILVQDRDRNRRPIDYIVNNLTSPLLFFIIPSGNEYLRFFGVPYYSWERWDIVKRPFEVLRTVIDKMDYAQWIFIAISMFYITTLNMTMVYGIYKSIKNRKFPFLWILLLILFYFAVVTGSAFHARFRIPIMPYIMLLSSYGMIELRERFKKR